MLLHAHIGKGDVAVVDGERVVLACLFVDGGRLLKSPERRFEIALLVERPPSLHVGRRLERLVADLLARTQSGIEARADVL